MFSNALCSSLFSICHMVGMTVIDALNLLAWTQVMCLHQRPRIKNLKVRG